MISACIKCKNIVSFQQANFAFSTRKSICLSIGIYMYILLCRMANYEAHGELESRYVESMDPCRSLNTLIPVYQCAERYGKHRPPNVRGCDNLLDV